MAPWRSFMHETDVQVYMKHRENAVRGLSNYMFYEASKGAMDGSNPFVPEDDDAPTKP